MTYLKGAYEALERAISEAQHVLLLTDQRPDGDTFGSSLAFAEFLRGCGKRVTHFATTPPLPEFAFLPGIETCTSDAAVLDDPSIDLVMSFDSSREEVILPLVKGSAPLAVVDHHASNTCFGDINVVDASATSTCEVVYNALVHWGAVCTPDMAKCLVTGLVTDTRAFSNSVANLRAFAMGTELLLKGGKMTPAIGQVIQATSVAKLRLWGCVFSRLRFIPHLGLAVTAVLQSDFNDASGASEDDIAEISDYLGASLDVRVILLIKERHDGIKVSVRSHGVDLLPLVKAFGGGGHPNAGGFFLPGARLAQRGGQLVVE
ncbi:hypothetical protein A3B32_03390 [Candidatus Uhrbacteria bacterium RIFCSPLOWO2_01_FULL_53_9]|uniref:DDH domain-containing protein n=2 Tax=Candidatus Uhriibacteriota TaxID=1752732 RepID=A0A1F7UX70_9BACT|nr:MAG: hypothetical protein A3C17_00260 [Candidatus Uhrbacteria bacterium RIFCSPHIGHO2_02_FULL_53_13]OGL82891.1 MAG: hypothetical protein A3B32_03390 [Candidatus Uhrbacteria bacterium RIFCSPLOWO2_01_FULL_53_9]